MYEYREGYRGKREVAPDVVGLELHRMRESGGLTSSRVVAEATPEGSALHPLFEWNDGVAGHEYRLIQARQLIRSVAVVVPESDAPLYPEWTHVPDRSGKEGYYVERATILDNLDEYERALTDARRYLDGAQARFSSLRRMAEGRGDRVEALAIAAQGFSTVREALELLRAA